MLIQRLTLAAIAIASSIFQIGEAAACSRGPGILLTPQQEAAWDETTLRANEVVVEMTVISQLKDSSRSRECRAINQKHETSCANPPNPSCDALFIQFIERCIHFDTSAQVDIAKIWKGQVATGERTVDFETGGFWRQDSGGGSCIGPIELLPGDQLVYCGYFDSAGDLIGRQCGPSPANELYREKWQTLRNAASTQPENRTAQIELATFLEEWNDRIGALEAYARVRRLSPNDPISYVGPGRIEFWYQHKKDYTEPSYEGAIALLQQALERDPSNAEAIRYMNRIRFLKGESVDAALVDFQGLIVRNRNLDNLDLRGKSFAGSSLMGVTFRNSKLDGTDFTDASLTDVDFGNASLRDAVFNRSPKVTFSDTTRFSLKQFAGADLTNARFEYAQLNLDLTFSDVPVSVLRGANLKNAKLFCSDLSSYHFELTGRTTGEVASVERGIDDWPTYWAGLIKNLRTIREIADQQPDVLTSNCNDAVTHYLSLPADCQPWLPADQRSTECTFLK